MNQEQIEVLKERKLLSECPGCCGILQGKFKKKEREMSYIVWYCKLCKILILAQIKRDQEKYLE